MPNYPEPVLNPHCKCRGNPLLMMMCPTGHMLECHWPYDCESAGCNHLCKYGYTPEEVQMLQARADGQIERGELPPYGLVQ